MWCPPDFQSVCLALESLAFSQMVLQITHSNLSHIPTSKWKNRYLTEWKNSRKKVPDTTQVGPPIGKRTTRGKHKACWVLFAYKVIVVFETVTVTQ